MTIEQAVPISTRYYTHSAVRPVKVLIKLLIIRKLIAVGSNNSSSSGNSSSSCNVDTSTTSEFFGK